MRTSAYCTMQTGTGDLAAILRMLVGNKLLAGWTWEAQCQADVTLQFQQAWRMAHLLLSARGAAGWPKYLHDDNVLVGDGDKAGSCGRGYQAIL